MLVNDIKINNTNPALVEPFVKDLEKGNVLSYGLSSFGYDVRLSGEDLKVVGYKEAQSPIVKAFKSFLSIFGKSPKVIDPKDFDKTLCKELPVHSDESGSYILLPPYSFSLGVTEEFIRVPRDMTGMTFNKSTYARSGLLVPQTILEAGWEGYLTVEMFNLTDLPLKVYTGEGICQVVFLQGNPCRTSYSDRKGKYQYQDKEVVFPKL
jgi:dCTP deaminase